MKTFSLIFLISFMGSCSNLNTNSGMTTPPVKLNMTETLHARELLLNIMNRKNEPLPCVEDSEEAAILLKTLEPEYDEILDHYQAKLDDDKEIAKLIQACEDDCSCLFISSLLEENEIQIEKKVKKELKMKISGERFTNCTQKMTNLFCSSSIYKKMEHEKLEFKLD